MKRMIRQFMVFVLLAGVVACGEEKPVQGPDQRSALHINQEAAEKGNADAQYTLAMMYEQGRGVEQSSRKAMEWLEKAARQNHTEAQYLLARMHSHGMDMVKAYAWFELAARAGDRTARQQMQVLHEQMSEAIVEQAQALADKWAAEMGD